MNDGDKALCIQDETIVNVAERNMKGIVPLYYEMAKAPAKEINSDDIYKSLILAYKANIGEISNNITKIWSSDNINLDVIKWLCMENNFTIDFAKTLYMPRRPEHVNKTIASYIKAKVPHFFVYAKDKDIHNVEVVNDSTVNKLENMIPNKRINFVKVAGKFDYKILMKNSRVEIDELIIETYNKFDKSKEILMKQYKKGNEKRVSYVYEIIRENLLTINNNPYYIADVLIKYLYTKKHSKFKKTLWECFGFEIISNMKKNILNIIECADCGFKIVNPKHKQTRCENCQQKREKEKHRLRQRKYMISKNDGIQHN